MRNRYHRISAAAYNQLTSAAAAPAKMTGDRIVRTDLARSQEPLRRDHLHRLLNKAPLSAGFTTIDPSFINWGVPPSTGICCAPADDAHAGASKVRAPEWRVRCKTLVDSRDGTPARCSPIIARPRRTSAEATTIMVEQAAPVFMRLPARPISNAPWAAAQDKAVVCRRSPPGSAAHRERYVPRITRPQCLPLRR